jgi:hypothetical protein
MIFWLYAFLNNIYLRKEGVILSQKSANDAQEEVCISDSGVKYLELGSQQ